MIVVDTNVLVYLLIPGPWTVAARGVLRRDPRWRAPGLWRSELRNVVLRRMQAGTMEFPVAIDVLGRARGLVEAGGEAVRDRAVLLLGSRSGCTSYDCEFVALAERLGVPLVTNDGRVLSAFPGTAVSIQDFARGR